MNKQEILNEQFKEAITKLERHASTSNEEVGKIQVCIEAIKTDLEWLKKFQWAIITTTIGSIVATIFSIIR